MYELPLQLEEADEADSLDSCGGYGWGHVGVLMVQIVNQDLFGVEDPILAGP